VNIANALRTRKWGLGFCLLTCLFWLRHLELLANDRLYPFHDSLRYSFSAFVHFANSLAHGFGFPELMLSGGGSEIAISSISMAYFSPHRLFAYVLYLVTRLSPLLVYKTSLLFGITVNALGWYFLWRRLFSQKGLALFGVFLFYCSGIALIVWHQDQILVTLAYVPWTLLFLVTFYQSGWGLSLAAACFGSALTLHYPHIHLLAGTFLILSLGLICPRLLKSFWLKLSIRSGLNAVFVFFLALSPLIYIHHHAKLYGSPIRGTTEIGSSTLEDYVKMGTIQDASASVSYLWNLVQPRVTKFYDKNLFYVTGCGFGLALFGVASVFFLGKGWSWLYFFTLLSAWASLGFNANLPQILYRLHFPSITIFRQYYHYTPYFLMGLIVFACLGLRSAMMLSQRIPKTVRLSILSVFILLTALQSQNYYNEYHYRYDSEKNFEVPRYSEREYLENLNAREFNVISQVATPMRTLVSPTENMRFFESCQNRISGNAWVVNRMEILSGPFECNHLTKLPSLSFPDIVFTPTSVKINPRAIDEDNAIILAINPMFLKSLGASGGLGNSGLTLISDPGLNEIHFKQHQFYWILLLQSTALAIGILGTRRKRNAIRADFPPFQIFDPKVTPC
jgi:hypothetical protein